MASPWSPAPGERVTLRIDPEAGIDVRIITRTVNPAHETPIDKFIYTPTIWASSLASLAILLLVSTAFATGTIRPAPPVTAVRPGEPTPTPDTRPAISIGGFVLQPPAQPTVAPATPAGTPAKNTTIGEPTPVESVEPTEEIPAPADESPPGPTQARPPQPCGNFLGILCPQRPRPPARQPQRVVPVPSPAPLPDDEIAGLQAASSAPPRGSNLELALQLASMADQNFAREVSEVSAIPNATPRPVDGR